MKFLKENWYKLMTGTAMLIFACGFFIYAVSPSYASYNGNSPSNNETYATGEAHVTGVGISGGFAYLVDYKVDGRNHYYKVPTNRFSTSSDYGN